MEKKQNRKRVINSNSKAILGTLLILLLGLALLIFVNSLIPLKRGMPDFRMAKDLFLDVMILRTALSILTLGLSLVLTYIYLKDYIELKSRFTLGILFTVISFMMYALTSIPILHQFFGLKPGMGSMGLFDIIPLLFSAIAMTILAWVSSK
jgi:uncharacterized BrkB/YihY/UPF0761 family membrane protein